ncbi:MAG: ComEC/Rec2 family competence protein [Flavobacteriales bacterium]
MLFIWRHSPYLRLLLPFLAGILIQINAPAGILFWIIASAVAVLTQVLVHVFIRRFTFFYRFIPGVSTALLLLCTGALLSSLKPTYERENHFSKHYHEGDALLLQLCDAPIEKNRSFKTEAEVTAVLHDGKWLATSGQLLLYIHRDSLAAQLEVDDIIVVRSAVNPLNAVQNPFEFNYKKYLNSHFIYSQCYASSADWLLWSKPAHHTFSGTFIHWRELMLAQMRKHGIAGQEYAVLAALILGKTDAIDFELMSSYASAGAIHVLAVSGLHVGLIYVLLAPLLRIVMPGKGRPWLKFLIPATLLWLYAGVTGFSPSVLRAAVMFTVFIMAESFEKKSSVYNTMSASALVLLCFNPYMIMEVGFQLSYLAVLGIVILQRRIVSLIEVRNKWLYKLWQLTAVSFAAQIATFALGMLYFHQFPVYFLVSNLVVIPLSTIILYGGLAFLAMCWFPPAAKLLATCISWLTWLMNAIVSWFDSLPWSIIQGISLSVFETYLLFGIVWCVCRWWLWRKSKAMIWALCFAVVVSISQVIEKTSIVQFSELCVHNIPGHRCITYCKGEKGYIIYDGNLMNNESRVRFHLKNYWNHLGIKDFKYVALDSTKHFEEDDVLYSYPLITLGIHQFALADSANMNRTDSLPATFILLDKGAARTYFDEKKLQQLQHSHLILTKDFSARKVQFLKENLLDSTRIHMLQEGALIVRGNSVYHYSHMY